MYKSEEEEESARSCHMQTGQGCQMAHAKLARLSLSVLAGLKMQRKSDFFFKGRWGRLMQNKKV